MERKREDPELQKLLFQFELILPLARNSGYGSEDDESSQEFFEERFPTWLDALTAWADESGQEELKRQASAASAAFGGIRTMITE